MLASRFLPLAVVAVIMARKLKSAEAHLRSEILADRLYAEVLVEAEEAAERGAAFPSLEELRERVSLARRAKRKREATEQIVQWFKHYDIDPDDPDRWQCLVIDLALDHAEEAEKPTKPVGATKWTYAECRKLVTAVETARRTAGNLNGALAAVQRLDEYKAITKLKPRYYEAKKRITKCVLPMLMGENNLECHLRFEDFMSAARRRRKASTKTPT